MLCSSKNCLLIPLICNRSEISNVKCKYFWHVRISERNQLSYQRKDFTFQSSTSMRSAVASSMSITSQSLFIIDLLKCRCLVILPMRYVGTIPLIGAKRLVLPLSALPMRQGTYKGNSIAIYYFCGLTKVFILT